MRGRGRKILVIGSGPIVIGQACEFDYSGTQACRALRAEGATVVLVNSNPATIMTDPSVADRTYIEPLTAQAVADIIALERPDALLPTVGGQTALNLALALHDNGTLARFEVALIGASVQAIRLAEDRQQFAVAMAEIGLATPVHFIVHAADQIDEALRVVGVPAIVRPSFTLGGSGGGMAHTPEQLHAIVARGLAESPSHQVLVEQSIAGWKEFELEVMRDRADHVVVVCSIENLDPMGVHTGDSITVAPAQTLTDREYQAMRDAAKQIIRKVGVETGGSNIQFAVHPQTGQLCVIEMNPRVSRSSALASKATGFPIAKIAAQLALGSTLDQIANDITLTTPASFEPSIDYVVVKIPRFDFQKFPGSDPQLGPQMQSVGEVMAIGRTFREALHKGLASLDLPFAPLESVLATADLAIPTPWRLLAVMRALADGRSQHDIYNQSRIDPWFLHQLALMRAVDAEIVASRGQTISKAQWHKWKREGVTDATCARLLASDEATVRLARQSHQIRPVYLRIDTCAGEFASHTPYLYSSYETQDEAPATTNAKVMILGSGANRIGQGIEFDYSCCHAAYALRAAAMEAIMVNCNPETVSTDYDTADRLYFEPLTLEHVLEIVDKERPTGVIVQLGGQTPLKLAHGLAAAGVPILGTSHHAIDLAEDRARFSELLHAMQIRQPDGGSASSDADAMAIAERIGYPVLVRPSYVLGGQSMRVVYDPSQLQRWLHSATRAAPDKPVLIDRYLEDAFEYDVDALCDGTDTVIFGILEHVEEAGVHSGDSTALLPPLKVKPAILEQMRRETRALGPAIGVRGLLNIQFAEKDGQLYVLEVNPRASRTIPFLAKATGKPLVQWATRVMLGETVAQLGCPAELTTQHWFAKAPVFPFKKFAGVDVLLGPEMRSTGEVMGVGRTPGEAFLKALQGAGMNLPDPAHAAEIGLIFLSVNDCDKEDLVGVAQRLHKLGFRLAGTRGTALYLFDRGLPVQLVFKVGQGSPHVVDEIASGRVVLVINTPLGAAGFHDDKAIRVAASARGVPCITTLSAAEAAVQAIEQMAGLPVVRFALQDWA